MTAFLQLYFGVEESSSGFVLNLHLSIHAFQQTSLVTSKLLCHDLESNVSDLLLFDLAQCACQLLRLLSLSTSKVCVHEVKVRASFSRPLPILLFDV